MPASKTRNQNTRKNDTIFSGTVDFFTSVKTTVWLLILLAIGSIVGTLPPQGASLSELSSTTSPFLFRLAVILDLHNVFRSWWFFLLLTLLSINLIACFLQRTPIVLSNWKLGASKKSFRISVKDTRSVSELKPMMIEVFSSALGGKPIETNTPYGLTFLWVKHRSQLFGFPLIHLGIIVILIGALAGMVYGFKGDITIAEGDKGNRFTMIPAGSAALLPFEIAVDDFSLTRYPSGETKEFRSNVRLLENGLEVLKGPIVVNHPLTYGRISLYQSGFRALGVKELELEIVGPGGKTAEFVVKRGASLNIPDTDYKILSVTVDPGASKRGAGAELVIEAPGNEPQKIEIFENDSEPVTLGDQKIRFKGYKTRYATTLQIGYDPGAPLVWLGSTLLVVGFFLTLFTNYRTIAIEIKPEKSGTRLEVSGSSRKMRREFREAMEKTFHAAVKGSSEKLPG